MQVKLSDASSQFCILHSALRWETENRLITRQGAENLILLESPDWTFRGKDGTEQRFDFAAAARCRKDLDAKILFHISHSPSAEAVGERMRTVLAQFQLFGFWDYYAGHEGTIRQRILSSVGADDTHQMARTRFDDLTASKLAPYYMAYTDYLSR